MRRGKRCPINKEFRTYSERTLTPSSQGSNPCSPAKWNLNDLGRWGFLFALFYGISGVFDVIFGTEMCTFCVRDTSMN